MDDPANQAKLTAVDKLTSVAEDLGCSLPELAVAFVIAHRAVTSAIIGPRTMDQLVSLLKAPEVVLTNEVLDRIDEIVPPGRDINPADSGWETPWVLEPKRRRRAH